MGKFKDGDNVRVIGDTGIASCAIGECIVLRKVVYDGKNTFLFDHNGVRYRGNNCWFELVEEHTPSWKEIAESFGASFEEDAIVIKCKDCSFSIQLEPTDPKKDAGYWTDIGWVEDSDGERICPVEQIDQFCAALQAWKELYEQGN